MFKETFSSFSLKENEIEEIEKKSNIKQVSLDFLKSNYFEDFQKSTFGTISHILKNINTILQSNDPAIDPYNNENNIASEIKKITTDEDILKAKSYLFQVLHSENQNKTNNISQVDIPENFLKDPIYKERLFDLAFDKKTFSHLLSHKYSEIIFIKQIINFNIADNEEERKKDQKKYQEYIKEFSQLLVAYNSLYQEKNKYSFSKNNIINNAN
ncbi:MAG: hypothetical protein ACOZAR_05455 [Patescibacteria group bacterium]